MATQPAPLSDAAAGSVAVARLSGRPRQAMQAVPSGQSRGVAPVAPALQRYMQIAEREFEFLEVVLRT